MARPHGYQPVARYFLVLLALLAALYAGVFLGGKDHTPKLGLDLRGGTTVTLRAVTESGDAPSGGDLQVARQIIEDRVNGMGVASAEVTTEGDRNIIISVPGGAGEQIHQLGATALLEMRSVVGSAPADPSADPNATDPAASDPNAAQANATDATPTDAAPTDAAPADGQSAAPEAPQESAAPETPEAAEPGPTEGTDGTQSIQQGADTQEEAAAIAPTLDCAKVNVHPTQPGENQFMVACGEGGMKYILGPVIFKGTQITNATSGFDTQTGQGWVVSLELNNAGREAWADYTAANIGAQTAIVLDQRVLSAPQINNRIDGTTQITGGFTQETAANLANSLKYGALPLTFTQSEARSVSATLGMEQLKAGMLAGLIGLGLVVIYCLLYYRLLGLITVASLLISGALVYAVLVLLSRGVGLTLTLSGIAGFIVAIGITADSFVVYFERLKDEVRDGRSMRSAVPRAWERARKTILSADMVSFLAAVILYLLTVGEVRGFAFTLGLSTVLDLVVVFLFTHPLVSWLSRFNTFSSPLVSGLGQAVRSGRVESTAARSVGTGSAKERAAARRAAREQAESEREVGATK
ncbi:protein translocase subunit SecD [Blastococcus sp. Marseille-P5729]|uniref:protein translocase subunit SecD n=1 Tax=Blastococcus sp. Marseille-P5729 TaxID=2086582 RepID=UPI000D106AA9|nr:protein translocase subunit SecD [Blastococcus sp. Marseille-P5729]